MLPHPPAFFCQSARLWCASGSLRRRRGARRPRSRPGRRGSTCPNPNPNWNPTRCRPMMIFLFPCRRGFDGLGPGLRANPAARRANDHAFQQHRDAENTKINILIKSLTTGGMISSFIFHINPIETRLCVTLLTLQ